MAVMPRFDIQARTRADNAHLAAFYFKCLTAPNNLAKERRELLEAGVAEHTVDALYPLAFADIATGIHRHLDRLPTGHLRVGEDWQWREQPESLREKIMELANVELKQRHVQEYLASAPTLPTADPRVRDLLATLSAMVPENRNGVRSVDIYNALYYAWWFMANRNQFPVEAHPMVDMMMLWAAEHVLFDIHLMKQDAVAAEQTR